MRSLAITALITILALSSIACRTNTRVTHYSGTPEELQGSLSAGPSVVVVHPSIKAYSKTDLVAETYEDEGGVRVAIEQSALETLGFDRPMQVPDREVVLPEPEQWSLDSEDPDRLMKYIISDLELRRRQRAQDLASAVVDQMAGSGLASALLIDGSAWLPSSVATRSYWSHNNYMQTRLVAIHTFGADFYVVDLRDGRLVGGFRAEASHEQDFRGARVSLNASMVACMKTADRYLTGKKQADAHAADKIVTEEESPPDGDD
ncbi:MAG: hypothetical protein ACOCXA_07040 [Planctomycetota bacterium]